MKKVYKYMIVVDDINDVLIPKGAQILTVQTQNGTPFIWALVDTEAATTHRYLRLVGTGFPLPDLGKYVGTFQQYNGSLVYHLFDQGES